MPCISPRPYPNPTPFSWDYEFQAGPSQHPDIVGDWSYMNLPGPSQTDLFSALLNNYWDIPVSRDSSLAGALTPVDLTPREGEVENTHQPAQPVVVPSHSGVHIQNVAPSLQAANPQRRAAYVLATPPSRHRRQPSRTVEFCRVNGCERWTDDRGKKLARHRACHFPGKVGVMCPGCDKIFSRSSVCGKHLKKCNRKIWDDRAAAKGTQDSWGQRVGQDLIDQSLVDRIYNPKTKYKL